MQAAAERALDPLFALCQATPRLEQALALAGGCVGWLVGRSVDWLVGWLVGIFWVALDVRFIYLNVCIYTNNNPTTPQSCAAASPWRTPRHKRRGPWGPTRARGPAGAGSDSSGSCGTWEFGGLCVWPDGLSCGGQWRRTSRPLTFSHTHTCTHSLIDRLTVSAGCASSWRGAWGWRAPPASRPRRSTQVKNTAMNGPL